MRSFIIRVAMLCMALFFCWPYSLGSTLVDVNTSNDKLSAHVTRLFKDNQAYLQQLTGQILDAITIEVPEDQAAMQKRLQQLGAPAWAAGLAVPQQSLVLLKAPRLLRGGQTFESLLLHEAAHLYVHQALSGTHAPWWLREGIAMLAAREDSWGREYVMGRAVFANRLLPISVMDESFFPEAGQVELAYAEAYYLAWFLESQAPGSLAAIIAGLAQGYDLNRSMYLATGKSFSQWNNEFMEAMDSRFSWMALGAGGSFWVLVSVMAAVVLVWRRRRMVKQMRLPEVEQVMVVTRPIRRPGSVRKVHAAKTSLHVKVSRSNKPTLH